MDTQAYLKSTAASARKAQKEFERYPQEAAEKSVKFMGVIGSIAPTTNSVIALMHNSLCGRNRTERAQPDHPTDAYNIHV